MSLKSVAYFDAVNKNDTNKITIKRTDEVHIHNSSYSYFMNSIPAEERTLFKRFVHSDTHNYKVNTCPSYWRVQGWLCLGDMLDYIEEQSKIHKTTPRHEMEELFNRIMFDHDEWPPIDVVMQSYNDLSYIAILSIDILHRVL